MPIARSIRVSGHVQGVFFREWTVMLARDFGIAGWVRNCPNGDVEIYALGESGPIDHFVAELHKGSSASRVDKVEAHSAELEEVSGFMRRSSV